MSRTGLKLSPEDIAEIESAIPFDIGFPLNFLFGNPNPPSLEANEVFLTKMSTYLDVVSTLR